MKACSLFVCSALILTGCAGGMLSGTMYRLDNGAQWPFGIQTSYGTGKLTASDPQSGEQFTGQYTGTYIGGGSSFNTMQGTAWNMNGGMTMMSGTGSTFTRPSNATARGVLTGTAGTVIEIYLDIRPGIIPKGHGVGQDNKGRRFQIQF